MKRPCGILLAAGSGRRFGSNKLLHPLDDGIPLLLHSVRRLKAALPQTFVVVDPADGRVSELLSEEGVELVLNPDAAMGMGRSLASGVGSTADAGGWVIALADMPWIQPQTIQAVAEQIDGEHAIVAPCYRGKRGHPVGFGRGYAEALMKLDNDEGARNIVAANRQHLTLLDTNDRGSVADIDCPGDVQGGGAT